MPTTVDKSIEVSVPVRMAYNQWTQFEEFPKLMGGVEEVRQIDDRTLHWVAEIAGVRREWDATILEQVPDRRIAWIAIDGKTNSGAVEFEPLGTDRTLVRLHLAYEPEGFVEQAGDKLNIVDRQVGSDLRRFKDFIEGLGSETGAWRGSIHEDYGVGARDAEDVATTGGADIESGDDPDDLTRRSF
ncbi:MAG TPA: SRPBCC family protein [Actinomycetes bacterium]|nr:SRPBCC family protein [Actinomycetes bacterium]